MVDVPRFELGASSMPRKRASRLRHTPNAQPTYDGHLRRMEYAAAWSGAGAVPEMQRPPRCPRVCSTN